MITIEIQRQKTDFSKKRFSDEYELARYLQDYLLVEKLHSLENEEDSWPMNYADSVKFLKSL